MENFPLIATDSPPFARTRTLLAVSGFACRPKIEFEHRLQGGIVTLQPAPERRALPAVNQPLGQPLRIGGGRKVATLPSLLEADGQAGSDLREALFDLPPEGVAHPRKLLAEPSQKAAHISLLTVDLLRRREETAHPVERVD